MHCPRCGEGVREGDRFCGSCGEALNEPERGSREPKSIREQLRRVVGRNRRELIVTGATLALLALAVGAFITLDSAADDEIPRDAFTIEADRECVRAKESIGAAGARLLDSQGSGGLGRFGQDLLQAVTDWRRSLGARPVPRDRRVQVRELSSGLREILVEAAALAREARADNAASVAEQAVAVDSASARVEEAIVALGLEDCAQLALVPGGLVPG